LSPLTFLLLLSVRQRTEKEAVAAGLFAVLGRKRGTVSGQGREEPDQLSCLWAFERDHRRVAAPVFSFVCPATANQESADPLP